MQLHSTRTAGAALALVATLANASDIHVPGDQPTIQRGIDAAVDGDRVLVAPGTYFEHIDFHGRNIQVIGIGGSSVTAIDGSGSDTVVRIVHGETAARLAGFTITHGAAPNGVHGGGIAVDGGATPTIEDNDINGNTGIYGGGVGMWGSGGKLRRNHVHDNAADQEGGGVWVDNPLPTTIERNLVELNSSGNTGGGMDVYPRWLVVVAANVIRDNTAAWYVGGVHMYSGRARFVNNLVHHNNVTHGGIAGFWVSTIDDKDRVEVVNNTFADNGGFDLYLGPDVAGRIEAANNIIFSSTRTLDFVCYDGGSGRVSLTQNLVHTPGDRRTEGDCDFTDGGLLMSDPKFRGGRSKHAYWLRPASPAIDVGDNDAAAGIERDLSGAVRVVHGVVDIGAYEFRGD